MRRARALSNQAQAVLVALLGAGGEWSHGYQLAQAAGIKSGTLYPLLLRLADHGYLEAEWQQPKEAGRPPRHAYRLTAAGLELARAVLANPDSRRALARGGAAT